MSHTYTRLLFHIVFSTKHRHLWITEDVRSDLHGYLGGIVRNIEGTAISVGGVADHVHILASIPAKISLSDAVRTIKSNSSKWMHETKSVQVFQWQEGYSAFTVSESNREAVIRYIENQEEHHRRSSYQDELIALLRKHGIEFDESTLWD
jgi:putative transposase